MIRRFLAVATLLTAGLCASPAQAWDPSTTHIGLTQQAAVDSALHSRWMRGTELQRGLFTALRVDPTLLSEVERRVLKNALLHAPEASGARALGGPGACPGAQAPRSTQRFCVDGDVWQLTALGWIELGIVAEVVPPDRMQHHFVDRTDRTAEKWRDRNVQAWLLRSRSTHNNGAPLAGGATRTNFSGRATSALGWLSDDRDPLAPPRLAFHLERAYTSAEPNVRDHHLAMALLCTGALLHVTQDMAVPAHARGFVAAFFQPLSETQNDRGLLLGEYAKLRFGRRGLPQTAAEQKAAARGRPLTDSLRKHILGDPQAGYEGVATFAATRFLSTGRLPPPSPISEDLSPEEAAQALLQDAGLDPVEREGAKLAPWPSTAGYLLTSTGRPLMAFERDGFGRVRPFLDEAVFRDTLALVLPQALGASRSLLDHLWPSFPATTHDVAAGSIELDVPATMSNPELLALHQTSEGVRKIVVKSILTPGKRNRVRGLPTQLGDAERIVLVLRGQHASGDPLFIEHTLDPKGAGIAAEQLAAPESSEGETKAPTEDEEEVEGLLELEEGESLSPDTAAPEDPFEPSETSESADLSDPNTDPSQPAQPLSNEPANQPPGTRQLGQRSKKTPAQPAAPIGR